jgi:CelD/BcsL family acetyltransferase involved in cellulose biosynthesis
LTSPRISAGEYNGRITDRLSQLDTISGDWLELWREHGRANPFTHPSWIIAWLKHLGGSIDPFIVSLWRENSLVGIAPLGVDRFGPWRRLVMLGSPMADYPDILVDPGHPSLIGYLSNFILNYKWNWVDFLDISERSLHLGELKEGLSNCGLKTIIEESSICPVVMIETGWDGYWAQKKSKTRNTINKKAKRLGREYGPLKLEILSDVAAVREGLEEAAGVHAARWARQHTRTIFSEQKGRDFFDSALSGLSSEGIVRLYLLRAGSALTAFSLSFLGDGIHYYYIPGFDQTYSKDSPGHLLLKEIIRESHEEELNLFDFMKGDEEYKFRWANSHHYTMRLLATKPDPWSRIGFRFRRVYFNFRDWARKNSVVRKVFFGIMNTLARLRKSPGK